MRLYSLILSLFAFLAVASAQAQVVHQLSYEGAITPVASEYFVEGIAVAQEALAEAVLIEIDTPGGLDSAMREIIKAIFAAEVPVIVYVAPSGSRAASAGAFITMAAHVAAMAPGTNIGSASPVAMMGASLDSTMSAKVKNDAIAYLESIADRRGRSREWARRFVESADNLAADRALEENVIDFVAANSRELLDAIDGRTVELATGSHVLATANATLELHEMSPRLRFLKRLVDPNIAYILLLLGIYGLFFELANPGALAPGILGGICILLALYALQSLPTNYAGIGLILLGAILFLLEIKVTSYGALTLGGLVSLVLGSLMLFESPQAWARVSLKVLVPSLIGFASFFILCAWLVVRSQRRPVTTGLATLIGEQGRVVEGIAAGGRGRIVFHGEMWTAESEQPVMAGQSVEVVAIEGRIARIRPMSQTH